jgi:hypothetical protein
MSKYINDEDKWQQELKHYRTLLKMEMLNVIHCDTNEDKRALTASWKQKYSAIFYKELVNMAKDKVVRAKVANWDIDNFDRKITE